MKNINKLAIALGCLTLLALPTLASANERHGYARADRAHSQARADRAHEHEHEHEDTARAEKRQHRSLDRQHRSLHYWYGSDGLLHEWGHDSLDAQHDSNHDAAERRTEAQHRRMRREERNERLRYIPGYRGRGHGVRRNDRRNHKRARRSQNVQYSRSQRVQRRRITYRRSTW